MIVLIGKKAFVEGALIKLVANIYSSHGCEVVEYHLVGGNANNRTIFLEEFVDGLTLLKAKDVRCYPEVGDGCIPGAGNGAQGRKEELVYRARDGVKGEKSDQDGTDVVGYPRGGEECRWVDKVHCDR